MKASELTLTMLEIKKSRCLIKSYENEQKEMAMLDAERNRLLDLLSQNKQRIESVARRYSEERRLILRGVIEKDLFDEQTEGGEDNG